MRFLTNKFTLTTLTAATAFFGSTAQASVTRTITPAKSANVQSDSETTNNTQGVSISYTPVVKNNDTTVATPTQNAEKSVEQTEKTITPAATLKAPAARGGVTVSVKAAAPSAQPQATLTSKAYTSSAMVTLQPNTQGAQKFTSTTVQQSVSYSAKSTQPTPAFSSSFISSNQSNYSAFTSQSSGDYSASYSSYGSSRDAYDHLIRDAAARHGVDPGLVKAIIHTESTFNPNARSRVGATGLMQLMPATARSLGVRNSRDPAQNIEGGVKYLAMLQNQFSNPDHVIAAYNAGPGNVRKYGGIPPFRETRNYVRKVNDRYQNMYSTQASLYNGLNQNRTMLAMNTTPAATVNISHNRQVLGAAGSSNFATPQNPTITSGATRFSIVHTN